MERLLAARRLRPLEAAPWVAAFAVMLLLPDYLQLGAQIIGMVLFALSFDLLLGYAGSLLWDMPRTMALAPIRRVAGGLWLAEPLTGLLASATIAGCWEPLPGP